MIDETFIAEYSGAVQAIVDNPDNCVGDVTRSGAFDILGVRIGFEIHKEAHREVLTLTRLGLVKDLVASDGKDSGEESKFKKSRNVHGWNVDQMMNDADSRIVQAVKLLVVPMSEDEAEERRRFIGAIVDTQRKILTGFPKEAQDVAIDILKRHRGYGTTHWGHYGAKAIAAVGYETLNTLDIQTFTVLENMCLGRGTLFGGIRREQNAAVPRQALYLAKSMTSTHLAEIINAISEQFDRDGIVGYGVEMTYLYTKAMRDLARAPKKTIVPPVVEPVVERTEATLTNSNADTMLESLQEGAAVEVVAAPVQVEQTVDAAPVVEAASADVTPAVDSEKTIQISLT